MKPSATTIKKVGLETKFFQDEWNAVIQANAVSSRDDYLRTSRIGRGTRLDRAKKAEIWKVFEAYRARLWMKRRRSS